MMQIPNWIQALRGLRFRTLSDSEYATHFRPGQVKQAVVLKRFDADHYLVRIDNFRFLARSAIPLDPATRLRAVVLATEPRLHLKLLHEGRRAHEIVARPVVDPDVSNEFAESLLLYFSIPAENGEPVLRVSHFPRPKGQDRPAISRVSLFVDLHEFGRTVVDVSGGANSLSVSIGTKHPAWQRRLATNARWLQEVLQALAKHVSVRVGE